MVLNWYVLQPVKPGQQQQRGREAHVGREDGVDVGRYPSSKREEDGKMKEGGTRVERVEGEGGEEERRRGGRGGGKMGRKRKREEGEAVNQRERKKRRAKKRGQNVLTRNRTGVVAATKLSK